MNFLEAVQALADGRCEKVEVVTYAIMFEGNVDITFPDERSAAMRLKEYQSCEEYRSAVLVKLTGSYQRPVMQKVVIQRHRITADAASYHQTAGHTIYAEWEE